MDAKKLIIHRGKEEFSTAEAATTSPYFFRDMPSFTDFAECVKKENYHAAPADWIVLVTDVKGSTAAIQEGRYQDVNLAGASAISSVMNVAPGIDLPYQFGGDGATILIPPELESILRTEMARLKLFIRQELNLDLRVGFVPVAELQADGHPLMVARYEMSPGNYLAMFDGAGVRTAEDWIKDRGAKNFQIEAAPEGDEPPNLAGLSCRWQPLKSKGGTTITLLIAARDKALSPHILKDILDGVAKITGAGMEKSRPTQTQSLRPRWVPRNLSFESRGHRRIGEGNPVWILLQTLMVKLSVIFKFKIGPFVPQRYMKEMEANTDYRKFDSMLRLVLDCKTAHAHEIEALLNHYQNQGDIDFGLHSAESAVMTCLLFSLDEGKHIHFVDGSDGGYAMAALALKNQISERIRQNVS